MLTRTAHLYDLVYDPLVDYDERAHEVRAAIRKRNPKARTLLDVGCGTGRYLERLRADYEVCGVDISPEMVSICASRLAGVPVSVGDMADFDLQRRFDAVICLFGSIGYTRTLDGMRSAVAAMALHLAPGGVLVLDGWVELGHWEPGRVTLHSGGDDSTTVVRMMRSAVDPDDATVSVLDMHYLAGTANGVEHIAERHELGLFSRAEYMEACSDIGLRQVRAYDGPFGGHRSRIIASAPED